MNGSGTPDTWHEINSIMYYHCQEKCCFSEFSLQMQSATCNSSMLSLFKPHVAFDLHLKRVHSGVWRALSVNGCSMPFTKSSAHLVMLNHQLTKSVHANLAGSARHCSVQLLARGVQELDKDIHVVGAVGIRLKRQPMQHRGQEVTRYDLVRESRSSGPDAFPLLTILLLVENVQTLAALQALVPVLRIKLKVCHDVTELHNV